MFYLIEQPNPIDDKKVTIVAKKSDGAVLATHTGLKSDRKAVRREASKLAKAVLALYGKVK